jgi:hypothetical protein
MGSPLRRIVFFAGSIVLVLLPGPGASAEMYKYVDSEGRMHFTQDVGQIPPEYRNQVERTELRKEINVTGRDSATGDADRVQAMEKRARELRRAAAQRQRQQAVPAARRGAANPLQNAHEPRKYSKDCSDYSRTKRCRKVVTDEWRRWDAANGGNNGKPDVRRRLGQD